MSRITFPLVATLSVAAALCTAAAPAAAQSPLGQGLQIIGGPAGNIAGIGLAFMDEFRDADRCLTGGEAAGQAAARSGAVTGVLGATVGGVLGAALGGDMKSIGQGAAGGLVLGGLAGSGGLNRATAGVFAGQRELTRQRAIDLCHLVQTARELSKPVLADMAQIAGPACGVDPARIFRGDVRLDQAVIEQCVRRNTRLTAQWRSHVQVVYRINQATCLSGLYVVANYDRQLLDAARRSGGSFMPTATPSCSGTDLGGQYSWLLR